MASTPSLQLQILPVIEQGDRPYRLEHTGGITSAYRSISFLPRYFFDSFEELRLTDYTAGRYYGRRDTRIGYVWAKLHAWAGLGSMSPHGKASSGGTHNLGHKIIVFEVGESPVKKFSVHDTAILPHSEFVRLSLKQNWKEGVERVIPLPDDHPDVFTLYQHWLYNDAVDFHKSGLSVDPTDQFEVLVKAYIFGDKIMDVDFRDRVLDAIVEKLRVHERFDLRLTTLVYDNTLPQSQLRRLWIHVYYFAGKANWLDEEYAGRPLHPEFVMDFCRFQALRRTGLGTLENMGGVCNFHEHGGRRCYRDKARWTLPEESTRS